MELQNNSKKPDQFQILKHIINHSASETELAELGGESLASDLDAAIEDGFVSLLHKEIRPLRTCIADTGKTVSSIADTLYQIQDGINNLCCNVTQMKSKVLSSDHTENLFEDEPGQEKDEGEEDALELVKDGVPVGEPEHLVQRMVTKLDSALRRRDENLKQAIATLEEDNQHLRREVEMYQARESASGNTELEAKIQELLDNMEQLRQSTPHTTFTPRMASGGTTKGDKELPPIDGKSVTKHKRRSKSRAKSRSRAQDSAKSSSSGSQPKERILAGKGCSRGDMAYQADSSTSSDTDVGGGRMGKPVGGMQVDVLHTMVNTAQQDNQLLRQDLLVQKEREAQLVKRNMELEAKLIRALTPRGVPSPKGERESPLGGPLPTEAVVPPIVKKCGLTGSPRQDQEVQAAVQLSREDKGCMTDLPPPLTVESPTSSSPSKSESPTKVEEKELKTGVKTRKSRSKVKVKRGSTMQEVTETGEVFGRGSGVDGGTPSPSPSRGEKPEEEKCVEETVSKIADDGVAEKSQANEIDLTDSTDSAKIPVDPVPKASKSKAKGGSLTRQAAAKEVKEEDTKGKKVNTKDGDKKSEKTAVGGAKDNTNGEKKESKKVTIDDSLKKAQKEEVKRNVPPPKTKAKPSAAGSSITNSGDNKLTVNLADTRSKVIEGDDFRVTITSNQDMVSCELSDREDEPGSPRKKIVITPKTPDKKVANNNNNNNNKVVGDKRKNEEKKEEVAVAAKKATGKIPIRQQYIKQVMCNDVDLGMFQHI